MHILLLATLFILFIQSDAFFFGFGQESGGCSNCPCGTASPSCSMFCPQSHAHNCQGQGYSTGYIPPVQPNYNNQGNFGNQGNFVGQNQQFSNFPSNTYQQPPNQQFQQQQPINYPPRLPPYSPPTQFTHSYVAPPLVLGRPHTTNYQPHSSLSTINESNLYNATPKPAPRAPEAVPQNNMTPHHVQIVPDEHTQIQSILDEYQKLVVPEIRSQTTKQEVHTSEHSAPSPSPISNQYQSISETHMGSVTEAPVVEQMELMTQSFAKTASPYTSIIKTVEQEHAQLSLQPPSAKIYNYGKTTDTVSNQTPRKPELSPEEIASSIEDSYDEKSMTDDKLQKTSLAEKEEEEEEVFTPKENRLPIKTAMVTMPPNYDDKEYTEYFSSPSITATSVEETTRPYGVTFQYIQETTTLAPHTVEYEIPVTMNYERQTVPIETTTTVYVPVVTTTTPNYEQITPTGYEFKNENNEIQPETDTDVGLGVKEETVNEEANPYNAKFRDEKKSSTGDSKKKEVLYSTNNSEQDSSAFKRNTPDVPLDKCNNERLREIMNERMRPSASVSKQLIYASASSEFSGYSLNVICSRHSFSYIVVTSPIFCEHKKQNLTCFAFFQP